jgi:hypothetical protein
MGSTSNHVVLLGCVAAVALASCQDERNPAPDITSVDPVIVSSLVDTPASIHGVNFFGVASASYDQERPPSVSNTWTVSIGDTVVSDADVSFVDTTTLAIVVPRGLDERVHPVTIVAPDGRSDTLADGFDVRDQPVGAIISIETEPGDGGEPVGASTLRAGDTLPVFAVARDDDGIFIADVEVSWSVDNAIGVIDAGPSNSATFEARTVGAGAIRGAHDLSTDGTSGEITVEAGDAASVAIVDAPSGSGAEVGDLPNLTTDDDVLLFAVTIDAFGNFVADTNVTWAVTGAIGSVPAGPSSSATVVLTAPGSGTVQITHAMLGSDVSGLLTVVAGQAVAIVVAPDTLVVSADDAPTVFTVTAVDDDGNATSDVGTLTWSVASGPITSIDPATGALDPGTAGSGTIRATSSFGPVDDSGTVTIVPGQVAVLAVSPDTLTVDADAATQPFAVTGVDGDGNPTLDLGTIAWSIATGPITAIDTMTGVFDPQMVGSGTIRAISSHGPSDDSGTVTVTVGKLATLTVAPDTMTVTADAAPFMFTATGVDGDGNATVDLGILTWTIETGPITAIGSMTGVFDPTAAGTGTVRATSSLGAVFDDSGDITVNPGAVASFEVSPDTAVTYTGGPTVAFSVINPLDVDGNVTADLGTITWTDDTIATIDTGSGVLTPSIEGAGFVTATSSLGPSDDSGTVTIYATGLVVTDVSAPAVVDRGQRMVEVAVSVLNATPDDAKLVNTELAFSQVAVPVDTDYMVVPDYRNAILVGAGATEVLRFRVDVGAGATLGTIDIDADVFAYMVADSAFDSDANATMWDVQMLVLPTAVISAPVFPDNRVCAGGSVGFIGNTSVGALAWDWAFSGGSPATSTATDPLSIFHNTVGNYPYWLTVTGASGAQDTVAGPTPIFVGSVTAPPHVAGEIIFVTPSTPNELIDLDSLPNVDMAGSGDFTNLADCAGTQLLETDSTAYVTVFSDRGEIDSAFDIDPLIPGVQVSLHEGTHFDDVNWLEVTPMVEGPGVVYAEYSTLAGDVTASGWLPVVMVDDDIKPDIDATFPLTTCGTACYGKGERWAFRFDEPMDEAAVLANTRVHFDTDEVDCDDGDWNNITVASALSYDAQARTLFVTPAVQPQGTYAVRVRVLKESTDASSGANELNNDFELCAVLENRVAPGIPAAPSVMTISADPVSPDGDSIDDVTLFDVTVDSETVLVRLQIEKGATVAFESVTPVSGSANVVWRGRDSTGRVLPNGFYLYRLTAENPLGAASASAIGVIEVRSGVSMVGVPPWM